MKLFRKPPAPIELVSFIEAFQRLNSFQELSSLIPDKTIILYKLLTWKAHFRDLSVQIHFGEGLEKKHIIWHHDSPYSLIHMGISILGKRQLWHKTYDNGKETQSYSNETEGSF